LFKPKHLGRDKWPGDLLRYKIVNAAGTHRYYRTKSLATANTKCKYQFSKSFKLKTKHTSTKTGQKIF